MLVASTSVFGRYSRRQLLANAAIAISRERVVSAGNRDSVGGRFDAQGGAHRVSQVQIGIG
jgi:hypothetical protein